MSDIEEFWHCDDYEFRKHSGRFEGFLIEANHCISTQGRSMWLIHKINENYKDLAVQDGVVRPVTIHEGASSYEKIHVCGDPLPLQEDLSHAIALALERFEAEFEASEQQ